MLHAFHVERNVPWPAFHVERGPEAALAFHVEPGPRPPRSRGRAAGRGMSDRERPEARPDAPAGADALEAALEEGLRALGEDASPARVERWARLARILDRWARRTNLTGHRGALEIARRLLLEAAALHRALPEARSIADLGSGAGIPGLPLALARPGCEVWLVEARERRHHFQRAAIRELELANAHALRGRVEELDARPCEGVVSQAFAKAPRALEWMVPWSAPGGWVAIATGPETDPASLGHPALGPGHLVAYAAPGGPRRAAWIAERRPEAGSAS